MKKNDFEYVVETIAAQLSATPHTQKEIEAVTGIDRRDVKYAIRELRLRGTKICSSSRGYWIAGSDAELDRTRARLWHEIRERLTLVRAMGGYPLDGQLSLLIEQMEESA